VDVIVVGVDGSAESVAAVRYVVLIALLRRFLRPYRSRMAAVVALLAAQAVADLYRANIVARRSSTRNPRSRPRDQAVQQGSSGPELLPE